MSFKIDIDITNKAISNPDMIKAVLIDLNGTLHIEDKAIPGAIDALKKLSKQKLNVKFVTNTTKESQRVLHEKLKSIGFELNKDDIVSSLGAAKALLQQRKLRPMLMLAPEALEDFQEFPTQPENPNAVVIGLAPSEFHYERLNDAFRHLQNGAQLIAIHEGKYYRRFDGLALGPGCFIKGLEYSAQCTAELIGKPNASFFLSALGDIPPNQAVMIGDDVNDDIKGAMDVGMQGYLVQTGKYRTADEAKIQPPPTEVLPSFVEAVDKILSQI
ncbi:unnamed protein product [Phyllotreta striolata]|uniref:Haloacid dehalogenase-like hydrolase domain-containing protein 2 n=1 Tax=Phyllotreta striolata TaxID=444603 RepID=A0A9N9TH15_PHYSR|nr:unnamed protein product [Phyllotreta striolata]